MDRRQSKATGFNNGLDPNGLISLQRRKSAFTSDSVVAVPQPSGSQQSQLEPSPCPAWPASHLAAPLPDADESKVALLKKVWIQVFDTDLYKMALPAILFSVQNMLM